MKKPREAPDLAKVMKSVLVPQNDILGLISKSPGPTFGGKYLHWNDLLHRPPFNGLKHEESWFLVKLSRQSLRKEVALVDKSGRRFAYVPIDPIPEMLHEIDLRAGGHIQMPDQVTNPETKDQYYVSSLIEEAITSSQLEGATTTRQVAKEMLRTGRQPRDRSERMILNNFLTMKKISEFKEEALTKELIFDIHRSVTNDTLDDPSAAGRFRRDYEEIVISDDAGTVFHVPPPASSLDQRMQRLCELANQTDGEFIHPALRSIVLHFALGYDHPFVDGNGRTARALFYWSMLRHGYWLSEFMSISNIILKAPAQYSRAFLHTETDENDLTYFILYHLRVIRRAIQSLHDYIARKTEEIRRLESELRGIELLNHRQRALIRHAVRHPGNRYTVEEHRRSHNVAYETARSDLLNLGARGLLHTVRSGKKLVFNPPSDLAARLASLH